MEIVITLKPESSAELAAVSDALKAISEKSKESITPVVAIKAEQPKAEQLKAEQLKAEQPKAEQPKAEQPKAELNEYNLEALKQKLLKKIEEGKRTGVQELLIKYGTTRASGVPMDKYPDIFKEIDTL